MSDELVAPPADSPNSLKVATDNMIAQYRVDIENNVPVDAAHEVGLRTATWVLERATVNYSQTKDAKERMYYLRMVLDSAKILSTAGSSIRIDKNDMGQNVQSTPAGRGNVIDGDEVEPRQSVEDRVRSTLGKRVIRMTKDLRAEARTAFPDMPSELSARAPKRGWPKGKKRGPRVRLDRAGEA